jgi:hypothetical protein
MPAVANVSVNIVTGPAAAKLKALNGNLKTTNTALKGTVASSAAASTGLAGVGVAAAKSLAPLVLLTGTVTTLGKGLKVFSDRQRDVSILSQGLSRLKGGTASLNDLNEAADRLGKQTLFNQEDFTRGFNLLTSFKAIGVDAYTRVAESAADIAQVNQVDVKTSFMQLAKALQDPKRNLAALNRSGIAFTENERKKINALMESNKVTEAHAMILGIVEGSYKDLAKAGAKGFAGDVDSLGESFNDFAEALGKGLIPVLQPIVQGLTKFFDVMSKVPTEVTTAVIAVAGTGGLIVAFTALKGVIVTSVIPAIQALNTVLLTNPYYALAAGVTAATVALYRAATANARFANDVANGTKPVEDAITKINEINVKLKDYKALIEANPDQANWIKKEIEKLEKERQMYRDAINTFQKLAKTGQTTEGLETATDRIAVKWEQIRETIASGLTSAIEGLISGTKSLGESLAGIAKSIASMYLKAAFMNMLPGLPGKAEGGYMANGIKPFASGGMATRPTLGLVGEAGEDEYIIPASKMASSMQRYSAGARGEAVIPGTGSSYAGGGAGGSTTVNYSGPILNFNSEEFVPKSAVGQIIASASARGASIGENRTLSTLKNSRSRRSALGL